MAIAGTWKSGAVTPSEYAGSLRQGTGINPVHSIRTNIGKPTGIHENLLQLPTDPQADFVPEDYLGPEMWGYSSEEAAAYGGEEYRYLDADHPNWGEEDISGMRRAGTGPDGKYSGHPQGWPAWGPHDVDPEQEAEGWPLPGPPGGAAVRAYSDGSEVENDRAIAVPTPGWRGGWLNKAHGMVEEAEGSAPSQYEVTTSMAQLHQTRVNTAATLRGTDDPRAPIESRLTGMKVKQYAKSSGMGGGPGSPDMAVLAQDLPYRPWFYRTAGLPPPPDTTYGTMTMNLPIERTVPVDAGEYVVTQEAVQADQGDATYGYSPEDSYGY